MAKYAFILTLFSCCLIPCSSEAQDTLSKTRVVQDTLLFSGQVSSWINYNHSHALPVWLGARYIPQLNYTIQLPDEKLIDFEVSANINGTAGLHPFDSSDTWGNIRPYRAWARYSTRQFELRLGLQKINFGSASMLRPLMWFDQVDPRDPLRITTGVWGLLGRYYFLDNTTLWLWGLYGNDEPKTWEIGKTSQEYPEAGGRLQRPVPKGEAGISYHFRMVGTHGLEHFSSHATVPESRLGLDAKWDLGVGVWFEGAWINKNKDVGTLTNQAILNGGVDYTFGLGNGLNIIYEQLLISNDKTAFSFSDPLLFSVLSFSYPVGLFDNVNAIVYYDWTNHVVYNFVNWKRQFNKVSAYLMGYWNPEIYQLPQQGDPANLFSGKGIQLMVVYNY